MLLNKGVKLLVLLLLIQLLHWFRGLKIVHLTERGESVFFSCVLGSFQKQWDHQVIRSGEQRPEMLSLFRQETLCRLLPKGIDLLHSHYSYTIEVCYTFYLYSLLGVRVTAVSVKKFLNVKREKKKRTSCLKQSGDVYLCVNGPSLIMIHMSTDLSVCV